MRKHLIQFLLVAVLSVFSAAAFAQTTVRGQLVDSETADYGRLMLRLSARAATASTSSSTSGAA